MKLILLYGPPAVGKYTVSKNLSKKTGITLFHSHMVLNDLARIFGYENPARKKLEFEFKLRIMEEAVTQGIDLITTGSITRENKNYYENLFKLVQNKSGRILLVRLLADKSVLLERVEHESRSEKINDKKKLKEFFKKYPENLETFGKASQLEIDTTHISPREAVLKIIKHYKL
jgi:deoxyadenosine/deoxycytidine kinase